MKHFSILICVCACLLLGSVGHTTEPNETLGRAKIDDKNFDLQKLKVQLDPKFIEYLVSSTKPDEDIYIEIPVEKEKGFWDRFTVGPCRFSAFGNRFDNNVRQTQNATLTNAQIPQFRRQDDTGYEVGLRCTEEKDNRYEISLGMTENALGLSSDSSVPYTPLTTTELEDKGSKGVFLLIKWKAR